MKKYFYLCFVCLCLFSNATFASTSMPFLEKRVKEARAVRDKYCANMEKQSDSETILCLTKIVNFLQTQIDRNYFYYTNTLDAYGFIIDGDKRNYMQYGNN